MTMNMKILPWAIRRWSSAPETKIGIGCSGGIEESQQYNYSSKRLVEEPVSIKILMGLLSKFPDTCKTRFWITFEEGLLSRRK